MEPSKGIRDSYIKKEIQREANRILENSIDNISLTFNDIYSRLRNVEDQDDKGIDFQCELEDRGSGETIFIFYLQNKGTKSSLKPLQRTDKKGLISFPLSVRHAKYYRYEINIPLIFTVCDVNTKTVYWHPIQLDDSIDEQIENAEKEKKKSITIYIDPNRSLNPQTAKEFIEDAKLSSQEQNSRFEDNMKHPLIASKSQFEIDKNNHILDQLHELFQKAYAELSHYPLHILIKNYPFTSASPSYSHYNTFKLTTDNDKLIELFEFVRFEKDKFSFSNKSIIAGVKDANEKIAKIIRILTQSLVFNIGDKHSRRKVSLYYETNELCQCNSCLYSRLEFTQLITTIDLNENDDAHTIMTKAYAYYLLGAFTKSVDFFKKAATVAKKNKQSILFFISKYNLTKLIVFLNNYYWTEPFDAIKNEIKKIDLEKIFQATSSKQNNEVLKWIKEDNFFNEAKRKIESLTGKIRDHYYSSIKGGYASNNFAHNLSYEYSNVHSFIEKNLIVFNKFVDIEELTDIFIEGLFASYAIDENGGTRIEFLDDWTLKKIVFYGNSDSVLKYFGRYKIKSIKYKPSNRRDSYLNFVNSFFTNYSSFQRFSEIHPDVNENYFTNNTHSILGQIIVLSSILEFDLAELNSIIDHLTLHIQNNPISYPTSSYLKTFIRIKRKEISYEKFITLLFSLIDTKMSHDEDLLETIIETMVDLDYSLDLTKTQYLLIENLIFNACSLCQRTHFEKLAVPLFRLIANAALKEKIERDILNMLEQKFNPELFFESTIFKAIPINDYFLTKYIDSINARKNENSVQSIFGRNHERIYQLDDLINICYSYNIALSSSRFDKFRGINHYYDWLLDMQSFDYNHFQIKWLSKYPVISYFNEFRKYRIIKTKIDDYLRTNRDPQIEKLYADLYYHVYGFKE